jgi:hypothetical protein
MPTKCPVLYAQGYASRRRSSMPHRRRSRRHDTSFSYLQLSRRQLFTLIFLRISMLIYFDIVITITVLIR